MAQSKAQTVRGWRFWAFVSFMLLLMALFVGLGTWQVIRLGEKERLIAEVEARISAAPVVMADAPDWPKTEWSTLDYRPLTVRGHYIGPKSVLVFTALSDAKGAFSGPGYWVLTPFALARGGTIFVNRGFVPQDKGKDFVAVSSETADHVLTGIGRRAEEVGMFTPAIDTAKGIDWVVTPSRLASIVGTTGPVAPITLDLPAGAKGELPQGGETVVEFPNNHLGYAATWFGFALLVPFLLTVWVRRQRRNP